MENLCFVFLAVSLFIVVEGTSITKPPMRICTNDTQCGAGECCYIRPKFLVVSKKRQALQPVDLPVIDPLGPNPTVPKTGNCERFHMEKEHCYPLETANGHCGCTAGTQCRWVSTGSTIPPITAHILPVVDASAGRRSMIFHPGPGSYRCARRI